MSSRAASVAPMMVASLLAAACGPSEERLSDIGLHQSLERLRTDTSTSPEHRRLLLADFAQRRAYSAVAGDAQRVCGGAYRKLLDAEDAIAGAEAQMKVASATGALSVSTLTEVARAEQLLAEARKGMPDCDAAAAKLAIAAR